MAFDTRKVLQDKPGSFLGYFLPLLILSQENEKLLDVVELFGLDRLGECIERLGGSKIEFPTWATIDALVFDAYLLYLFDQKAPPKALERIFDAPYKALRARELALRSSLSEEGANFPGARKAAAYHQRLNRVQQEIKDARDS